MATVVAGILDVGFIAVQAARGTFSHFNTSGDAVTTIGQYVFMTGIPGLFVADLVIALILLFQRVGDRSLTRAIHAGLLAVLTWQAFRGQPLIHPDALTVAALGGLLAATAVAVRAVKSRAEAGHEAGRRYRCRRNRSGASRNDRQLRTRSSPVHSG